jgi:hypothetical protein
MDLTKERNTSLSTQAKRGKKVVFGWERMRRSWMDVLVLDGIIQVECMVQTCGWKMELYDMRRIILTSIKLFTRWFANKCLNKKIKVLM